MVTRRGTSLYVNLPSCWYCLMVCLSQKTGRREAEGVMTDGGAATDLPTVFVDWPKCDFVE